MRFNKHIDRNSIASKRAFYPKLFIYTCLLLPIRLPTPTNNNSHTKKNKNRQNEEFFGEI